MPYLDANGVRFHVQALTRQQPPDAPPRPKVVMIHGLILVNMASYYYTIAHPVAQVADTYLYDLRGNGRSEMPMTGYTVQDHVTDLRSLLSAWQVDEPVHLVANSFGGAIALAFTHQFPDRVASLVLIDAHFATEGWGEHMAGALALAAFGLDEQEVKDWLAEHGSRQQNRQARDGEKLLNESTLVDDLQRERPFPDEALRSIGCPTLAIYGEGSEILDRAHALERHIPRCELHIVPDCSHLVLLEDTPFVLENTLAWLNRFSARRPVGQSGGR